MSEAESSNNRALDELMNYVNSLAETQTNASYSGSLNTNMPGDKPENYKNWALDELMNYLDVLAANQPNISCGSSFEAVKSNSDRPQIETNRVEVLDISRDKVQKIDSNNFSYQVAATQNCQAALSPTNMANLVVLIQQLRSSNSNLVQRVTALNQAIAEFHQSLEVHKQRSQVAESMLLEKNQAWETACQTIECQQNLIETLNAEIASHQEFVTQSQAIYSEQSYQLLEAKNNCRELRTRLQREQQHSLQLKFALEKCLATPTIKHQHVTPTDVEADFAIPKAPPIQTWTVKTPCISHEIELDWERQPEITSIDESAEVETDEPITSSENAIASSQELLEQPLDDCSNEIIEVQWQDLANLVENNLQDEALADLTADLLAELDEEANVAPPLETSYFNANKNWPSPVVYPSRPPKGRKSLAAIELPPFRRRA